MVCIKSVPRSALAGAPPDGPYLAAGTMADSAVLSFSSTATLEIFKLDFQSDAHDLALAGACTSAERFNRLSWGKPLGSVSEEYSLGLLAGGLGDGSIGIWNPLKMISSEDENASFVGKLEKHVWCISGLRRFKLLSISAGSRDNSEISLVSWNPKFQQILSSTSYNGITVVWDLRQQKPVTSFADSSRWRCSVLQWNADVSTQFIISSYDDSSPSLRVLCYYGFKSCYFNIKYISSNFIFYSADVSILKLLFYGSVHNLMWLRIKSVVHSDGTCYFV